MAVFFNDLDMAKYFIAKGALIDESNEAGVTPLERAALFGYADMLELLARLGCHVDKAGMTPLILGFDN